MVPHVGLAKWGFASLRRSYGWQATLVGTPWFMWFAYVIRSLSHPDQYYIGLAGDCAARLQKHNEGCSPHTSRYMPWELDVVVGFKSKEKAVAFERYLKTGSGFSFRKRHF